MNKVILKGRLSKDVDLRTTTTGKNVATTNIAVNRYGKDAGADFIPLVVWGDRAENFAKYLSKGREVLVEGKIQIRSYEGRDGGKRYATEVIVDNFEFCGNRNDGGSNSQQSQQPHESGNGYFGAPGFSAADNDIPF